MARLVLNLSGVLIDFDNAVNYMDDDLREKMHNAIAPCTDQQFFTAYETAYFLKFKVFWEFSKENPQI